MNRAINLLKGIEKMDIKIFVTYHKETPVIHNKILTPIHAGRANASVPLGGMIGDNTGDHISEKNPNWCELTVVYWMWKNVKADYYGLFHYRRLFNFNEKVNRTMLFHNNSSRNYKKYKWDEKSIKEYCKGYDVVLAPNYKVHPVNKPNVTLTVREFYDWQLERSQLDEAVKAIEKVSPEMMEDAIAFLGATQMAYYNMFIMSADLFHEYAPWAFKVLDEVERAIPVPSDPYYSRIHGFISERLLNIFILYKIRTEKIRVKYVSSLAYGVFENLKVKKLMIDPRGKKEALPPIENTVTPTLATLITKDNWAHACGSLASLLERDKAASAKSTLVILHSEVGSYGLERVLRVARAGFGKVLEINLSPAECKVKKRVSVFCELPSALAQRGFDKVLYFEPGTLFCKEAIFDLWTTDMEGNAIAAVPDAAGVAHAKRLGYSPALGYFNDRLMLLNLAEDFFKDFSKRFKEKTLRYRAYLLHNRKDVLNLLLLENIARLPLKFNVQAEMLGFNRHDHAYRHEDAMIAASAPVIISGGFPLVGSPFSSFVLGEFLRGGTAFRVYSQRMSRGARRRIRLLKRAILRKTKIAGMKRRIFSLIRGRVRLSLINKAFPKSENVIVFQSTPLFSDNPAALYHFISSRNKRGKTLVWLTQRRGQAKRLAKRVEEGTRVFYQFSLVGMYYRFRAKYVVISHAGDTRFFGRSSNQRIICLWHGMPLKTVGLCEKNVPKHILDETIFLGKHADFFVTSDFFKLSMISCFSTQAKNVHITGQPRNDKMFATGDRPSCVLSDMFDRSSLEGMKVVLATPTYKRFSRGNVRDVSSEVTNPFHFDEFCTKRLNEFLMSNKVLLIIKPHPFDEPYFKKLLPHYSENNVRFVFNEDLDESHLTTADLLTVADVLVTDFSSVFVDYALLDRPILFIGNNAEEYEKNRGFILSDNFHRLLPGEVIHNQEELQDQILSALSSDGTRVKRDSVAGILNKFNDGSSCERVCNVIGLDI